MLLFHPDYCRVRFVLSDVLFQMHCCLVRVASPRTKADEVILHSIDKAALCLAVECHRPITLSDYKDRLPRETYMCLASCSLEVNYVEPDCSS